MRRRNYKDLIAGLTFIAIGLGFSTISTGYDLGTASEMGPGFFPFWLGILLAVLGVVVLGFSAFTRSEAGLLPPPDLKILLLIVGSVVLFGALLTSLGLVLCIIMTVLVASLASHEFRLTDATTAALFLVVLCVIMFVYVLKLQIPVWPAFLGS